VLAIVENAFSYMIPKYLLPGRNNGQIKQNHIPKIFFNSIIIFAVIIHKCTDVSKLWEAISFGECVSTQVKSSRCISKTEWNKTCVKQLDNQQQYITYSNKIVSYDGFLQKVYKFIWESLIN
jgi:hypothetical protein